MHRSDAGLSKFYEVDYPQVGVTRNSLGDSGFWIRFGKQEVIFLHVESRETTFLDDKGVSLAQGLKQGSVCAGRLRATLWYTHRSQEAQGVDIHMSGNLRCVWLN
jgi:hypothetical protein